MNRLTTAQPPATPELTPAEHRWLATFRAMDTDAQHSVLPIAEAWAEKFSRHPKPKLRLVGGGAK